jgi:hypothetical protein
MGRNQPTAWQRWLGPAAKVAQPARAHGTRQGACTVTACGGRRRFRQEGAAAVEALAPVGDGECTGHGGGVGGSPKHCADGEVVMDGGATLFNGDGTGIQWSVLPRGAPATRGRSMEVEASLDSNQHCATTALTVGG